MRSPLTLPPPQNLEHALGPKMYQLILHDKHSGQVIKWVKMMKGISIKGNVDMFSNDKIPLYRNPVLDFCCVLQYGLSSKYSTMQEVWKAMQSLKLKQSSSRASSTISIVLTLDQTVFKHDLMYIFTDKFVVSQQTKEKCVLLNVSIFLSLISRFHSA